MSVYHGRLLLHSNQVSMSGIQERMLRQYTCHILCLSISDTQCMIRLQIYQLL